MIEPYIGYAIQFLMLIVATTTVGITIAANARKGRESVISMLAEQHKEAMEAVATARRGAEEKAEIVRQQVGESILAMRQQITDLGFYIRDNFVRERDIDNLRSMIESGIAKLEARCRNIEAEIHDGYQKSERT